MDPMQFDALSRTVANGVSRRQAVARFGAAGLLAGLTSALGRERTARALPAVQADTCRLAIVASIRLGPSADLILQGTVPGELRGELRFAQEPDGAIDRGRLHVEGGAEFPVVGQATGRALHLRVAIAPEQTLILVGTASERLNQCRGDVDGLLTGPRVGDLGDWHATATALGASGGSQPGATDTASPAPAAPTATSTPPGAPAATAPAGTSTTSPAAAPVTATATATETPTSQSPTSTPEPPTSTLAPTETPTPEPPTPTPVVCPTGTTECGGVCVDLLIEPANCGACGTVCPQGTSCQSGTCTCLTECCGDDDCGGNEVCQDGACIGGCAPNCEFQPCGASDGCGGTCTAGTCPSPLHICQEGVCFCPSECCQLSDCPFPMICVGPDGFCFCESECCADADCAPNETCAHTGPGDVHACVSVGGDSGEIVGT